VDLVQSELSEPYVIYTFRCFLHHALPFSVHPIPQAASFLPRASSLTPLALPGLSECTGSRGYIAMLSVSKNWCKRGIDMDKHLWCDFFFSPLHHSLRACRELARRDEGGRGRGGVAFAHTLIALRSDAAAAGSSSNWVAV
ncbi:hypothetical protein FB451DRAFT_1256724, partial [Mycena latifolia]